MASRLSFQTWLTSLELWAGHQLVSEIFPNVSRNMLKTQFTPTLQIAANTSVASWVPKPSSTSKTSVTLSTELTMQLNCKTCWTDSSKSELNFRALTSTTFLEGHKNTPLFCNSIISCVFLKFAIEKPSIVDGLALTKNPLLAGSSVLSSKKEGKLMLQIMFQFSNLPSNLYANLSFFGFPEI